MANIYLAVKSYKPGSSTTVLIDNEPSTTAYRYMGFDLGNAAFDKVYSGPRGTQGARLVGINAQNRLATFQLAAVATSHDNLEAALTVLWKLEDELRRFGGTVTWRPQGGSFSMALEVLDSGLQIDWAGTNQQFLYHQRNRVNVSFGIVTPPYAEDVDALIYTSSLTAPTKISPAPAVPGDSPALGQIGVQSASAGIAWALLAWSPRVGANAPFGIVEAETADSLTGWVATADATYRGSTGLKRTTAGAETLNATFAVDPTGMIPDDYRKNEIDIEVWARVQLASTLVNPRLAAYATEELSGSIPVRYSDEFGSVGRTLVKPSSGTVFRFVRVGTITFRTDLTLASGTFCHVGIAGHVDAGSTGQFGIDYLLLCPAHRRACGPTGKVNDSSYPSFLAAGPATKTIFADLSGTLTTTGTTGGPASGLGGSLLEWPPGLIDFIFKTSDLVPDDPTPSTASETLSQSLTVSVIVTPRYRLARAS
jgi:hypothetical protein